MPLRLRHCLFLLLLFGADANANIHHQLTVDIDPVTSRIAVEDTLSLPERFTESKQPFEFLLHEALKLEGSTAIEQPSPAGTATHLKYYRINRIPASGKISLRYAGMIKHELQQPGEESARSFSSTLGIIDQNGVFLDGNAAWYPYAGDELVSFELSVSVPSPWFAVSGGENTAEIFDQGQYKLSWVEHSPQDDIYLVAAPFTRYSQQAGNVELQVYLREDEPALAQQYLDTGSQYMAMYQKLLGKYPYQKFAVIENFWETGFGMPSFTLLGPRVMRFPFILHSSYPHEILHNWWGNGVFVDYNSGNWAEGLTAYLADHLIAEQRGNALNHRRNTLQKYTDYVSSGRDFPLRDFRSRHDSASEAVGYGKALMLFHMLRIRVGDQAFRDGLRKLYKEHRFTKASFDDVAASLGEAADTDLSAFFSQWVERTGAPSLSLSKVETLTDSNGGKQLLIEIEQTQSDAPYQLLVPVVIQLGNGETKQTLVSLKDRKQSITIEVPATALSVSVDPQFDVFRRLDPREIPSALSQGFGADQALAVLPATADTELLNAYRQLIESWRQRQRFNLQVVLDSELDQLPKDKAVWIFGWDNRFRQTVSEQASALNATLSDNTLTIDDKRYHRNQHAVVVTSRHPANPAQTLLWLASDNINALPGLARKLPHYGKYSYLAFSGDEPENIDKGQWQVLNSPLVKVLSKQPIPPLKLKPRPALAEPAAVFSEKRMLADIHALSDESLKGRGLGSPELNKAADYIASEFKKAGLQPYDEDYFQEWRSDVAKLGSNIELKNVIGIIPGTNPLYDKQSVIVAAHYDHLGLGWPDVREGNEGKTHHGADDNASGVAVMLELARILGKSGKPERSVVFIAFTAEEAGQLGSSYYINNPATYPAKQAMAILNLDTVGRLEDKALSIFGADSASEWDPIFRGVGFVTGIKMKTNGRAFGASDHANFHEIGVPGVQFFSGVHLDYHRPTDTVEKIDGAGLVKVATVVRETTAYLTKRPQPLTSQLGQTKLPDGSQTASQGRKVSIGTVPDFDYNGEGVRLSGIVANSPAAKAGLKTGDILIAINGGSIADLRSYAEVLRKTTAGETLLIRFLRDGVTQELDVVAGKR